MVDLSKLNLPFANHEGSRAIPKGIPNVLAKEEKREAKKDKHRAFRAAVWARDEGRSRASGHPLVRAHVDPHKAGEVHHVIARSIAPERIFDPENGLLLSRFEHALAEAICPNDPAHHLLDIEGDEDRAKPQIFIWRDVNGVETKRRQS